MLQEGQQAPNFTLPDETGKAVTLAEHKSSYVLIYFYPKALTPGCTVQACSLRDARTDLERAGVTVFGISKDKPSLLNKFVANEKLNFTLLSDEDHQVAESYGVWQEKSLYGRKYMGMTRSSFLVNNQGVILKVWPNVTPKNQAQDVLEWIKSHS